MLINRILDDIGYTSFTEGFDQAFNLDSEYSRDIVYSRSKAQSKVLTPSISNKTLNHKTKMASNNKYKYRAFAYGKNAALFLPGINQPLSM